MLRRRILTLAGLAGLTLLALAPATLCAEKPAPPAVPRPAGTDDASGPSERESLHRLAVEMRRIKDQLDAEHHGSRVLSVQEDVIAALGKLIAALQDRERRPSPPGDPGEGRPRRERSSPPGPGSSGSPAAAPRPLSPAQLEALTHGTVLHGPKEAAEVSSRGARWGLLAPRMRDEIDQPAFERLPVRYQRLICLYSLAAAEEQ